MIRIRPYKPCDAETILSWCRDEETFQMWGGSHLGSFPLSAEQMNHKYFSENGGCAEADNFFPMTAFDDGQMIGHFIIRYVNEDCRTLRFGWVIVDDTLRGKKYGQRMLQLGLKYAFEILGADRVTIGVYETNEPAYRCYLRAGFRLCTEECKQEEVNGRTWSILELCITKDAYSEQR
ncbi:MAG: GNAT family N-acetyltransferase [Solobacterium sp.]|nr:GNAT family N-acetyltransferase [Solobacterium sp.]